MGLNPGKVRSAVLISVFVIPLALVLSRTWPRKSNSETVGLPGRRYRWCRFCEEASPIDGFWAAFCPVCGGGNALPGEFLAWDDFRHHHPDFPGVPQPSVRYPLTSPTAHQALAALRGLAP